MKTLFLSILLSLNIYAQNKFETLSQDRGLDLFSIADKSTENVSYNGHYDFRTSAKEDITLRNGLTDCSLPFQYTNGLGCYSQVMSSSLYSRSILVKHSPNAIINEAILTGTQVLFGLTSGLTEGYRLEEHYGNYTDLEKLNLNRKWHDWSTVRNASCLTLGIEIGLMNNKPLPIAIDVLTSAIIFWFVNDGVINKVRGFSWFRQADTRLNFFEQFNRPSIKISLLIVAIGLRLIKIYILN